MKVPGRLAALLSGHGARGASALALSSVLAQAITLAATPVLSRIYPPEAFGYLTLVVSVTGIIAPAVALRLESAVLLPRRADAATAVLALGASAAILVSLLSVGLLEVLFSAGLLETMARLPGFSWWVGGISFVSGLFVLLGQFALRAHRYIAVGLRSITQAVATAVAQLGFALVAVSPLGLVGGHAAGRAAGIVPLIASMRSDASRFAARDLFVILKEYWRFPLIFTPAAILNAAALSVPIICAGVWFDVADAGQWGMAERVLALPMVIVGAALGQVVEANLAHHFRERIGGNRSYYLRVSGVLLVISLVIAVVVWFTAPAVIPFVLGEKWSDTAVIMQLLIPMLVTRLVAGPMSKSLVVAQWASVTLWLDLGRAVIIGLVLWRCWLVRSSLQELVLWTAIAFAAVYLVTWVAGLAAATRMDVISADGDGGRRR
jgi:O-antigen/teichoic acid export membrane protein